jgi:hypothetical protein
MISGESMSVLLCKGLVITGAVGALFAGAGVVLTGAGGSSFLQLKAIVITAVKNIRFLIFMSL